MHFGMHHHIKLLHSEQAFTMSWFGGGSKKKDEPAPEVHHFSDSDDDDADGFHDQQYSARYVLCLLIDATNIMNLN